MVDDFVYPLTEDDVVEITGKLLMDLRNKSKIDELKLIKKFIEDNKCCNDLNCDGALKSEEAIIFINKRIEELKEGK